MASGINSTFRQVGIATGIAVLGTIFSHQVADGIRDGLAGTPAADQSDQIAAAVTGGQTDAVLQAAPAGVRDQLAAVATSSFVDALNHITVIAMVLAFAAAALCFVLIRQQDFVQQGPGGRPGRSGSLDVELGELPAPAVVVEPHDEAVVEDLATGPPGSSRYDEVPVATTTSPSTATGAY